MKELRGRAALLHLVPQEMATFVHRDFENLRHLGLDVTAYCYDGRYHGWLDAVRIASIVARTDVTVSWFVYHQAYFATRAARFLRRPTVAIIGGFDVVEEENPKFAIPESRRSRLEYALQNASVLCAVSRAAARRAERFAPGREIKVVYHGIHADEFPYSSDKAKVALTVGHLRADNAVRKGIETFVAAASALPDVEFVVVGEDVDGTGARLAENAAPNVRFYGRVDHRELVKLMQSAKAYVQASTHESFGVAVAEAMLCGCIPVVSDRGALREVVGDTGVYVPVADPGAVADGVARTMAALDEDGLRARERVVELFPVERRREGLREVLQAALGGGEP